MASSGWKISAVECHQRDGPDPRVSLFRDEVREFVERGLSILSTTELDHGSILPRCLGVIARIRAYRVRVKTNLVDVHLLHCRNSARERDHGRPPLHGVRGFILWHY